MRVPAALALFPLRLHPAVAWQLHPCGHGKAARCVPASPSPAAWGLAGWHGTAWHGTVLLRPMAPPPAPPSPSAQTPSHPTRDSEHSHPAELLCPSTRGGWTGTPGCGWERCPLEGLEESGGETEARRTGVNRATQARGTWSIVSCPGEMCPRSRPVGSAQLCSPGSVWTGPLLAQSELLA